MVRTWPSLARRAHVPARLLGEVALAVVLGAALALTWSDGTPDNSAPIIVVPAVPLTASVPGYADPAHSRTFPIFPTPIPQVPIPTSPPAMILIPTLDVHRPVEAVGVDSSGTMYNTQNLWNAGWYSGSPVPGAPGDSVIEGHAGYPNAPLLFGKLRTLKAGDHIVVVLADGSQRLFLVDSLAIWPAGQSPTGLGEPYGPPRLTLVTCTGPFDDHYKTYADRLVLEASYAGLA